MKTRPWLMIPLLAAACAPGGDGTSTGVDIPSGGAADCGDSPPSISSFVVEDGGVRPSGGVTILARVTANDNDGDLHYYTMRLWWDAVVDGVIDTSTSYSDVYGELSPTPCGLPQASLTMAITTTGSPPLDTELDFGVLVYDDRGHASDDGVPSVVSFRTPAGQ